MPSYVITGVSRGIGIEFLEKLSSNPANTLIGLVRNVDETKAKIASWNRQNIHIIHGDVTNYDSLKKAAEATSAITSGSLDYLIANAAIIPTWSAFDPLSVLGQDPARLTKEMNENFDTNVTGNVHLFNLFMPLILKGNVKKVVTIGTGLADIKLAAKFNLHENAPYSISKVAMNMVVAKFQAEYKKDGVLFVSISPGTVNTGQYEGIQGKDLEKLQVMGAKFLAYEPNYQGPILPNESVNYVLQVVENASLKNGWAGAVVSHYGNKQWL